MSADNRPSSGKTGLNSRLRIAVGVLLLAACVSPAFSQKAVILVRHAEKADASRDPALSEDGKTRAEALAERLSEAGISAIYCSEYQRTRATAGPLAARLKIPIETCSAADTAGLVEKIRTAHAGDIVLVVGHSNTIPDLMKGFGHPAGEKIADDDFGGIFILVPQSDRPPVVIRLRY